jgi:hypothetical protein
LEDTWVNRDLPVLDVIVRRLDEGTFQVTVEEVSSETGFDPATVDRAITALEGDYVAEYQRYMTGGDPRSWCVRKVTSHARRAVGQWPTPEGLIDSLAEAFREAADDETNSERKGKLREVASFLSSTGREVATEIVSKIVLHATGMG